MKTDLPMTAAQETFLKKYNAHLPLLNRAEAAAEIDKIIKHLKSSPTPPRQPFFVQHVGRARRPLHASQRKWNPGDPVQDLNELNLLISKRRYVFVKGRSAGYHWSFVGNWQFWRVAMLIREGKLLRGVRNVGMPYKFQAQWCEAMPTATVKSAYIADCYEIGATMIQARTRGTIMKKCREAVRKHIGHDRFKLEVAFNDEGQV